MRIFFSGSSGTYCRRLRKESWGSLIFGGGRRGEEGCQTIPSTKPTGRGTESTYSGEGNGVHQPMIILVLTCSDLIGFVYSEYHRALSRALSRAQGGLPGHFDDASQQPKTSGSVTLYRMNKDKRFCPKSADTSPCIDAGVRYLNETPVLANYLRLAVNLATDRASLLYSDLVFSITGSHLQTAVGSTPGGVLFGPRHGDLTIRYLLDDPSSIVLTARCTLVWKA